MLLRQQKEMEIIKLMNSTPFEEQVSIVRNVMTGLQRVRGDARPITQLSTFERRVHHASAIRGWAAIIHQSQTGGNFNVDFVAKNVHIGWARSIVSEWDPEYVHSLSLALLYLRLALIMTMLRPELTRL